MPSRRTLWLRATFTLAGLWTVHAIVCLECLNALPYVGIQGFDLGNTLLLAAFLALVWVTMGGWVSGWLCDRLLGVKWLAIEEAGDVGPFLRDVLVQWKVPLPRLGVLVDAEPCVLTYGMTRGSARMVISSGLLTSNDLDAQCAVMAREAGHLVSGDVWLATIVAAPMFVMERIRTLFESPVGQAGVGAAFRNGAVLSPVLGGVLRLYAFLYAPFSACRDRWADDFSRLTLGSSDHLSRALLGAVRQLGRPVVSCDVPDTASCGDRGPGMREMSRAVRAFSLMDVELAGRVCTLAAYDGRLRMTRLFHVEGSDRYGGTPPVPRRIRFASLLPLLSLGGGLVLAWFFPRLTGLPFLLWGCGRLVALGVEFWSQGAVRDAEGLRALLAATVGEDATADPGDPRARPLEGGGDAAPASAASAAPASAASVAPASAPSAAPASNRPTRTPRRVDLEGTIVGYGVPGESRSPHEVLEVERVHVSLRTLVSFEYFRPDHAQTVLETLEGIPCRVRGLLRMERTPYVEVHSVRTLERPSRGWRSGYLPLHILASLLLLLFGAALLLS